MTHPLKRRLAALLVPLLVGLSACGGGGGKGDDGLPSEVLDGAKRALDATPGVHLVLNTPKLPEGISGVLLADGIGTHAPAFEGNIKVSISGIPADVAVVAVDSLVYAKLPFTQKFVEVDPADYGAPDPSTLMDPTTGISSWLVEAKGVSKGKQVRDGDDVLTTYEGALAGEIVKQVIPTADDKKDFEATFTIDESGKLRSAELSGSFYAGKPAVAYTITLDQYGTDKVIKAP